MFSWVRSQRRWHASFVWKWRFGVLVFVWSHSAWTAVLENALSCHACRLHRASWHQLESNAIVAYTARCITNVRGHQHGIAVLRNSLLHRHLVGLELFSGRQSTIVQGMAGGMRELLQSAEVTVVTTAEQLKEEVQAGTPHIEIRAHLDLSPLPFDPDYVLGKMPQRADYWIGAEGERCCSVGTHGWHTEPPRSLLVTRLYHSMPLPVTSMPRQGGDLVQPSCHLLRCRHQDCCSNTAVLREGWGL